MNARSLIRIDGVRALRPVNQENEFTLPTTRALYAYWAARLPEEGLPARTVFQAPDLGPWMANLVMVDVLRAADTPSAEDDLHYRIIGSNIVDALGRDHTGKKLSEIGYNAERSAILKTYLAVADAETPQHAVGDFIDRPEKPRTQTAERLFLPFRRENCPHISILAGIFFLPSYISV